MPSFFVTGERNTDTENNKEKLGNMRNIQGEKERERKSERKRE